MTENPLLQGNTSDFLLPGQGLGQGETLSILGKVIQAHTTMSESQATKVSFAMLVINAIAYIGIERFTTQLQDLGSFQDQIGQAQSAVGSMETGLATIVQNAYWNGKNAQFSTALEQDFDKVSDFAKSIYTLFDNRPVAGVTSTTPTWQSISIALPKQGGGYAYIQPFTTEGKPNGQDWVLVHNFINQLNGYMFSNDPSEGIPLPTDSGSTDNNMPIYAAMALSDLQVNVDSYPEYMVDASGHVMPKFQQYFENGTLFQQIFGSFDSNAPLEALQNVAGLLQTNYSGNKEQEPLLQVILNSKNANPPFSAQSILQPLADMMADYLYSKYQGNSGGSPSAGGYIPGISGSMNQFGSISLYENLNTSVTQGTSELQSQTQQNSADAQEYTAQISSYDNIGQSVVSANNQAQNMMTQNQTSS